VLSHEIQVGLMSRRKRDSLQEPRAEGRDVEGWER